MLFRSDFYGKNARINRGVNPAWVYLADLSLQALHEDQKGLSLTP